MGGRVEFLKGLVQGWWRWVNITVTIIGIFGIVVQVSAIPLPKIPLPWYGWVFIILVTLLISVFETAFRRARDNAEGNWVSKYQMQHKGALPPLPENFAKLVNGYEKGKPVSKDIKFMTLPSPTWLALKHSEQQKYIQLVEWKGEDPKDYVPDMRPITLTNPVNPPTLSPRRKHRL